MPPVFDILLAALLVWLAWRIVSDEDLLRSVIQFIVLGLILAATWLRLGAPDVALAEAAVGSGITGALFLKAMNRRSKPSPARKEPLMRKLSWGLIPFSMFVLLAWAGFYLPSDTPGLGLEVGNALPESGVSNPVTAVLLNFRSYDTLLEVAVLFVSVTAIWSLISVPVSSFTSPTGPILRTLVGLLVPLIILTACHLLWLGAFAPGGAFQGGALLGGAMILMLLGGKIGPNRFNRLWLWKTGMVLGLVVFIGVGTGALISEGRLLQFPRNQAGNLILAIESAALISISLALGALVFGGRPATVKTPPEATEDK